MDKPDVEYIDGLSPAISIDQKSTSNNPRSTVGTVTEIYDYLRLLYARAGTPYCPNCGDEIKPQSIDEIVNSIMKLGEGTKIQILAPIVRGKKVNFNQPLKSFVRKVLSGLRLMMRFITLMKMKLSSAKQKTHNPRCS